MAWKIEKGRTTLGVDLAESARCTVSVAVNCCDCGVYVAGHATTKSRALADLNTKAARWGLIGSSLYCPLCAEKQCKNLTRFQVDPTYNADDPGFSIELAFPH